ncbi:MAG: YHS domain-containing (seleno)protein [Litorimonas sp.]
MADRHIWPMKAALSILAMLFLAACGPVSEDAQRPEIYTSWRDNVAIGGYDVVSFHAGKPLRGRTEFQTIHKDATWRFDTQANLDLFVMNPDAFTPQFGGYCAWAVANDKLAPGKPEYWHVENGKLYLNYSLRVQKRWDALRDEFIARADDNWPELLRG